MLVRSNQILLLACFLVAATTGNADVIAAAQTPPKSDSDKTKTETRNPTATTGGSIYVPFHNAGVRLKQPKGFQQADTFDGFHNDEGSSVLVTRLTGPYVEVSAGFRDKTLLKKHRMTVISRKDIKVSGLAGVLLEVEQPAAGIDFRKFVVCIGDGRQTRMITATFPKTDSKRFAKQLKDVVETVQIIAIDDTPADVGFTVNSRSLKLTKGVAGKMLIYTLDGKIPQKDLRDPLLIVAPSLGNVRATAWPNDSVRKQFTRKRIEQIPNTKITKVVSVKPVTIDGQSGFETIADAVRTDKDATLKVYQVMLFGTRDYFLVHGSVGIEQAEKYISEFKAIARTLKRSKKK